MVFNFLHFVIVQISCKIGVSFCFNIFKLSANALTSKADWIFSFDGLKRIAASLAHSFFVCNVDVRLDKTSLVLELVRMFFLSSSILQTFGLPWRNDIFFFFYLYTFEAWMLMALYPVFDSSFLFASSSSHFCATVEKNIATAHL